MRTTTGIASLGLLGTLLPIIAFASCGENPCQELARKAKEFCERCDSCGYEAPDQGDPPPCREEDIETVECLIPCYDAPCTGDEFNQCVYKCD